MKSPIVLLSALLTDVKRLEPDVRNLDRDLKTIEARVKHEGIGFLTVSLSSYCDALDEGLAKRRFTCPLGFKTGRYALPRLFSGLLCEVFDEKSGQLKEKPNLAYLKILREILRLFKKLPLTGNRDEHLDHKAKVNFLQCDDSISQTTWNDRYVHHIGLVCNLILNQLEGVDYENTLQFRHGPGAVMEKCTANQKWYAVSEGAFRTESLPFRLEELGLDTLGDLSCIPVEQQGSKEPCYLPEHETRQYVREPKALRTSPDKSNPGSSPQGDALLEGEARQNEQASGMPYLQSRLVTVAKNSTSRRTITVEPVLLQYVQQALKTTLRDHISKCRIMANSVDLTDQSHNQKLAMEGSRTGLWATIDLSSASDLLSLELVKLIFRNKPTFLDWLIRSRSSSYTDGKNSRILKKYAGMGNATTMPVQSVTFAVIAMAAILDAVGRRPTFGSVMRASKLVRVYGDDIIVPAQYSQRVVDWLEHFGLRVNKRKSFTDYKSWWEHQPCFRESCGVDAYGGVDVTPLYLRALPEKTSDRPNGRRASLSTDPSAIASCVATSNLAWERCLYTFSATLAQSVEDLLKKRLPLVPAKSSALGWHSRVDACNPTKWDPSLQRLVLRAPVLKPIYRSDPLNGVAALFKFYHVPLLGRGPRHLERSQVRFSSRIVWRWMPAECG